MYCERLKREAAAPRERLDIETRRQISKRNTVWRAYPAVPTQLVQVATTVAAAGARHLPWGTCVLHQTRSLELAWVECPYVLAS